MTKEKITNVVLALITLSVIIDGILILHYLRLGKTISAFEPGFQIVIYLILGYGIYLMRRSYYWILFIINSIMIQFPIFLWIFRDVKFYDKDPIILIVTLPLTAALIILSLIFLGLKIDR
ncbi:MAG: hypothetical protein FJ213_05690 [Ignavibacteria bacterium]|nr:hypothetical protein [Ignavibacteria bacterium]